MGTSPPKSCDFNPQESSESDGEIQGFRIKVYFKVSENSEIPYFHNLNYEYYLPPTLARVSLKTFDGIHVY